MASEPSPLIYQRSSLVIFLSGNWAQQPPDPNWSFLSIHPGAILTWPAIHLDGSTPSTEASPSVSRICITLHQLKLSDAPWMNASSPSAGISFIPDQFRLQLIFQRRIIHELSGALSRSIYLTKQLDASTAHHQLIFSAHLQDQFWRIISKSFRVHSACKGISMLHLDLHLKFLNPSWRIISRRVQNLSNPSLEAFKLTVTNLQLATHLQKI